jgi:predicted hotdog family 3-hydroxylacyl-ACP dehydratase
MSTTYEQLFNCLPHGQAMRLLASIDSIDTQSIRCTVTTHQALDHPMRYAGRLGSACGVEMAAQAVAMHSAHLAMQTNSVAADSSKGGMLTAVRELKLCTDRLDNCSQPISVHARFQAGDATGALYTFSLCTQELDQECELLNGRMSVVNFVR